MKPLCIFALSLLLVLAKPAASGTAIINVTVFPSPAAEPFADAVILIDEGVIKAVGPRNEIDIPPGYEILDRRGKYVTAGFWNSHVHLTTPALLESDALSDAALGAILNRMFTRFGFTTIFDIASSTRTAVALKERLSHGSVNGPRILTVGDPFYPPDGTPVYVRDAYRDAGLPMPEVTSPDEAAARVDEQHATGVDGIKVFTGAITGDADSVVAMPAACMQAITDTAHALHMPVFAHPTNMEGLRIALDNGADILAHTSPLSGRWSRSLAEQLKTRNVALIPTLALFEVHPNPATPVATALQQVMALQSVDGDILFGTDTGFIEASDAVREFELMGKVMDWRQILASLTTTPARRFGETDQRGRVVAGLRADLVVLDASPLTGVDAFTRVHEVFRAGRSVFRREAGDDGY